MGSWSVGNWPSFDPHNFSQLRPNDPSVSKLSFSVNFSRNLIKKTPITYHPTHERTIPPPDQVISSEAKNILLRQLYQRSDEKLRPKRAASDNLAPEQESKHPRASSGASSSDPLP
ncbi:hypothetical protein OSB04_022465 [Centaurea solstitialis]|uniref:DET1- and DDB1-associated protein 1 domain-containing protein n=1 Tax=Centaurea solstitialis TaxID=347529 RepID=A0AA38W600_9ASTR|nr:hypothetical protein OSB04_022465 [Centaurea solstitialis]